MGEDCAVEADAAPGVDLGLTVEWQMVGVLGSDEVSEDGPDSDATLDQVRRRRRPCDDLLAGLAGILRLAGDGDAE